MAVVSVNAFMAWGQGALPGDVFPDSRSRLPLIDDSGSPSPVESIRGHRSGYVVRWESPLGRRLTELAILVVARELDQPYEWSLHEMAALAVGLDPATIDRVRNRGPFTGLSERQAIVIRLGREIFGTRSLTSETYALALNSLGRANLVDIVDLMGSYAATAVRLTAVNQQMPPGWKQFLPLPFTPPDDIYMDSRSRLPLRQGSIVTPAAPTLYSRSIAPEGTGPAHIRRHGAGLASLESSVGPRLMSLAALLTAREFDCQYQWTMNELAALQAGLEPAIIDRVRDRRAIADLPAPESALIEFSRELFRQHHVSAETYAHALDVFGATDLVDFINLMAQHASDAVLLTAFDQHLPDGQRPLLPIP